ncbi:MAG: hypothetical protein R3B13_18140 [Polyangiaceae bacterium]
MRHAIWFPVLVLATACNLGDKKSGQGTAASGAAATGEAPAAAAAAEGDLTQVSLDPLPLQIKVKAGGMGAMDMSVADKKSVTVDIGGGTSLNIQPEAKKMAEIKKGFEGDTILFPFKKWEKESDDSGVLQFENDGKKGYIGFMLVQVSGQGYLCKTTGLDGVPSVEVAEKNLQACKTLTSK